MHLEKKFGGKFREISKVTKKSIGISFPASGGIYDRINPNADASRVGQLGQSAAILGTPC